MEKYKDREWLRKKYWDEGLSTGEIGIICKTDYRNVWAWMNKFNIPRRSTIPKNTGYKNRDYLYEKYIGEKLTTIQIGKLYGVGNTVIGRWLKKLNISSRSRAEAAHLGGTTHHCNLSQEAINWISGEMLGDGSVQSVSPYSAYFVYSSKHLEYIKYVKNTLKSFGIEGGEIVKRYHKKENTLFVKKDYYSYFYRSYCYVELLSLRNKWYPRGKKIIPKDLELNPLICRQHYIGDGTLEHPKTGKPYAYLFTNGFTIFDVEWLTNKINKLGFKATRQPSNNSIRIFGCSLKKFLKYIGNSPTKCYRYKFKY